MSRASERTVKQRILKYSDILCALHLGSNRIVLIMNIGSEKIPVSSSETNIGWGIGWLLCKKRLPMFCIYVY